LEEIMRLSFRYLVPALGLVAQAALVNGRSAKAEETETRVQVNAEISEAMGKLRWGITKQALQHKLADHIQEAYRLRLAKARDASETQRLRRAADDEAQRVKDSYVELKRAGTHWDESFLRGELSHERDESMLASRDQTTRTFYFFISNRLWKLYTIVDALVFPEGNFAAFAALLQQRFGSAKQMRGELSPGVQRHWVEWQDRTTRLRAIDQTNFYGFYCLVFEDKQTVIKLAKLRSHASDAAIHRASGAHALTLPADRQ
jgi:hypothetical protein